VVASGPPAKVARVRESHTGPYLTSIAASGEQRAAAAHDAAGATGALAHAVRRIDASSSSTRESSELLRALVRRLSGEREEDTALAALDGSATPGEIAPALLRAP
jgi:hypothetical protein